MSVDQVEIDHAIIEAAMARMPRDQRAAFWRDHVGILGLALIERGVAEEVVRAILADHFVRVRELHDKMPTRRPRRSPIDLAAPLPIGTEIHIGNRMGKLLDVRPIIRTDGRPSFALLWEIDGAKFTSGLRSGLRRVRGETKA